MALGAQVDCTVSAIIFVFHSLLKCTELCFVADFTHLFNPCTPAFNIITRVNNHRRWWTKITVNRRQMKRVDLGAAFGVPVASGFVLFGKGHITE